MPWPRRSDPSRRCSFTASRRRPTGRPTSTPTAAGWTALTWREVGERVKAIACGLRALGLDERGARRHPLEHAPRLDPRRPRHPRRRGRDDDDLPVEHDAGLPLHPEGLRTRASSSPRTASRPTGSPRGAPRSPSLVAIVTFEGDGTARRLRPVARRADGEGAGLGRREPGTLRGDRRGREDRRPRDAHLHLGHDRAPKGVELTHDCWVYEAEGIDALEAS